MDLKVRILDDAKDTDGNVDGRHANAVTNVSYGFANRRAACNELSERAVGIADSPVRDGPEIDIGGRMESQLVPADLVSDIEGLVKVGLDAEKRGEERFGGIEITSRIDDRA